MAGVETFRRGIIIVVFTAIFWVALPLALVAAGRFLDTALSLTGYPAWWGWLFIIGGLAFLTWAALWLRIQGHGLPVSALPPPNLVVSGPYGLVRHPMYLGYNVALVGLGFVLGSPGLLIVGGPCFLMGWILYALNEERGLRRRFGAEYQSYQSDVAIWPRPPLYQIVQVLVAARVLPVSVEGREHLPRGAYVVVSNHACYLDPALLSRLTWRRIRFLATAEAFRPRLFGWLLRRAGAIPLRRYRTDPAACRRMVRRLSYGEIVGAFVEGERAPLGAYEGAMPRSAGIIPRLGVPVIPVGILGSYDVGPRWSDALRRRPVTLRIGPPVVFDGNDPALTIDNAITTLLAGYVPRVHLAGLRRERLSRVLWACPNCLQERLWDASALRCANCGAQLTPTADGLFTDASGHIQSLAALGQRLQTPAALSAITEITCAAAGFVERSMIGAIQPLEPVGDGTLYITRSTLSFSLHAAGSTPSLTIPLRQIRSATTERADTLQIATAREVWQFHPATTSAFRLHRIVLAWAEPRLERPIHTIGSH